MPVGYSQCCNDLLWTSTINRLFIFPINQLLIRLFIDLYTSLCTHHGNHRTCGLWWLSDMCMLAHCQVAYAGFADSRQMYRTGGQSGFSINTGFLASWSTEDFRKVVVPLLSVIPRISSSHRWHAASSTRCIRRPMAHPEFRLATLSHAHPRSAEIDCAFDPSFKRFAGPRLARKQQD